MTELLTELHSEKYIAKQERREKIKEYEKRTMEEFRKELDEIKSHRRIYYETFSVLRGSIHYRFDSLRDSCPFFMDHSTNIVMIMKELVAYSKKIIQCDDQFDRLLKSYGFITISNNNFYFSDIIDMYNKEFPCEQVSIESAIIKSLDDLKSKIARMEQFQAQILDKLTIFAEMIDDMQKIHEKRL